MAPFPVPPLFPCGLSFPLTLPFIGTVFIGVWQQVAVVFWRIRVGVALARPDQLQQLAGLASVVASLQRVQPVR